MGLVTSAKLRVVVDDGAKFALRAVGRAAAAETGRGQAADAYDAVIVDAYDAAGNVPASLWSAGGSLVRALSQGLLRSSGGLIATNFLPSVDLAPPLAAYRSALSAGGQGSPGLGFSVVAEGT